MDQKQIKLVVITFDLVIDDLRKRIEIEAKNKQNKKAYLGKATINILTGLNVVISFSLPKSKL